ncbi:unnamed protein product, partial [Closterium sp. NIES-53]
GHERYFLLVVDDYSRYTTVFPLRSKEAEIRSASAQPSAAGLLARDLPHLAVDGEGWRCVCVSGLGISGVCPRLVCRQVVPPDVPGLKFYHPTSRRVLSSQDVTFDESVPYYRLFPYRTAPLPPLLLFLAPGPPPVDPLPPQGPAPSGVSQVDAVEPVEVAVDSGAARGAEPEGAEPGGAESRGAEPGGAESGGAEPGASCELTGVGTPRSPSDSTLRSSAVGGRPSLRALGQGPTRVRGQGHERYFLLVVDDFSRYTSVFPLRRKDEVTQVLIDWIRVARLQLRERFASDFPVLRLHSDRGGEFSSDLLRAFCRAEGIRQTFTLPASPQQNGIAERRIGMVMDVARTSMIHAAAPHFLWPFAVQYAANQINLQPRVSMPKTSPTLRRVRM